MEKIYSEEPTVCRIAKARPETVKFLLGYSKSLNVINYNNMQFDNVLN
ncbi:MULTISPECIES: hypothetical protein [Flavobacteriaceae]|nr:MULTISPECIES: hypothetical protein [Flavobacteriaceae]NJB35513.1 hypothetical protein [Croceivirga sp. JEA036]